MSEEGNHKMRQSREWRRCGKRQVVERGKAKVLGPCPLLHCLFHSMQPTQPVFGPVRQAVVSRMERKREEGRWAIGREEWTDCRLKEWGQGRLDHATHNTGRLSTRLEMNDEKSRLRGEVRSESEFEYRLLNIRVYQCFERITSRDLTWIDEVFERKSWNKETCWNRVSRDRYFIEIGEIFT